MVLADVLVGLEDDEVHFGHEQAAQHHGGADLDAHAHGAGAHLKHDSTHLSNGMPDEAATLGPKNKGVRGNNANEKKERNLKKREKE